MAAPSPETRSALDKAIGDLIEAIEAHELWVPPRPHPTLFHVWDFVKRSKYWLSEYENIQQGKQLQYPGQFSPAPGTGDQAALKVFNDVCSRSMMTKVLLTDNSGKLAMLTGNPGPPVDFGPRCKELAEHLMEVTPFQNMNS